MSQILSLVHIDSKQRTMKSMTTIKLALFALLSLYIVGCADDIIIEQEPTIIFPDPVELIPASLLGSVEDEAGLPIEGATVTCLNCLPQEELQTDEDGNFQFLDMEIRGNSGYLSISAPGQFDSHKRLSIVQDRINYTRIQLRQKLSLGTINTTQGGTLDHTSGASIVLPSNGIIKADGTAYFGDYEVYMSWIDPTSEDLNMTMMGDLSAIDSENNLVGLSTYGMLQVELETPDGTPLNLAIQNTATLEFPVPSSLRGNAPATIPLWSYDEAAGYWIEEGSAELIGDEYIGEVTHFSTWNVDVKIDPVNICGRIGTEARDRKIDLSYFQIKLSGASFQGVGGWLCDDGSFSFINVPAGEELTLDVFDFCGELVERIELGPYNTGKVDLDLITLEPENSINFIKVTGMAIDCDSLPLTQGLVSFDLGFNNYIFPVDTDGSFEAVLTTCGEFEASVQVVNTNLSELAASIPIFINSQSPDYNLKTIQACGDTPEEYFYFKVENVNKEILVEEILTLAPQILLQFNISTYTIQCIHPNLEYWVNIEFTDLPEENKNVSGSGDILTDVFSQLGLIYNSENLTINFSSVGPEIIPQVNEYVEGSFEGFDDNNNFVTGTFRAKPD